MAINGNCRIADSAFLNNGLELESCGAALLLAMMVIRVLVLSYSDSRRD